MESRLGKVSLYLPSGTSSVFGSFLPRATDDEWRPSRHLYSPQGFRCKSTLVAVVGHAQLSAEGKSGIFQRAVALSGSVEYTRTVTRWAHMSKAVIGLMSKQKKSCVTGADERASKGQSSGQKNQLPIRGTRERLKAKEAPNASSQLPCCAVRAGISVFMGQSTDAQRVICVKCRPNLYSRRPSPARNPLARRKRTRQIQLASRSVSCALEQ